MPRYYKYGYQGPQYAGMWKNQVTMPGSQGSGPRVGLGAFGPMTALLEKARLAAGPPFPGAVFVKGKWVKPPSPNAEWIPATATVGGHWQTKRSPAAPRVAVTVRRRPATPAELAAGRIGFKRTQDCRATGMPSEMVRQCVRGLAAGIPLEDVVAELQGRPTAAQIAAEAASAGPITAPAPVAEKPKSRLLLYGGVAAAGLVVLYLVTKRRR